MRSGGTPSRGDADVEFRILGPIEVLIRQKSVSMSPGRQQGILGALLLDANRVVSTDHLIDAVWEHPPNTARSQVQICVSALRHLFRSRGLDSPIITHSRGYLIEVADERLDVTLFDSLVGAAEETERAGDLAKAADLLKQALDLWRGPVLGGDVGPALRGNAMRLDEERLRVMENRVDLELRLGRHHQLIGGLRRLVEENPWRERLRALLMRALQQSGRSAEALDVYRSGREITVAELGLEPGEDLKRVQLAVLAGVEPSDPEPEPSTEVEARPLTGPHQLPADILDFAGREALIRQAEAVLVPKDEGRPDRAVRVLVISGKAGVGKTTLAVHVAHRLHAEHFEDGQLYCNFAGMWGSPAEPSTVLARFLRALGVPGSGIPDDLDERAELYRSLLDGRRMLVVMDDVTAESQVAPLLPGSASCAVIVTSRVRLTGISGARLIDVDVLRSDQAVRLLANVIGADRVDNEPNAALALVGLVGGLPLALRIVAARLAARPHWSLASMLGRLADERHRLDELAYGDMVVRASLSLTYDGLEPKPARLFRLLGLVTAEHLSAWVGAALLDDGLRAATGALELLVDAQMLDVVGMDLTVNPRYAFHDIIRVFAREQLAEREAPQARAAALHRVLGGWLGFVDQAHREIYGGDFTVLRGTAARWWPPDGRDAVALDDALHWLDAERPNACSAVGQAADAGLHELSWELAVRLVTLFEAHSYFDEWQETHERALDAVRAAGNTRGEAALLCSLGSLHLSRHRPTLARSMLPSASRLFSELGDDHGLAMTRRNLGLLAYHDGQWRRALEDYHLAVAGFRRVGDLVGEAHVLAQIARIELDRGDHDAAIGHLNNALALCRDVGGGRVEAQVLHGLGEAMLRQRRYNQARDVMGRVLDVVRRNGDTVGESYALHTLGLISGRTGDRQESERLLRAAIDLRETVRDQAGAARVALDLAVLLEEQGENTRAVALVEQALATFADRNMPAWEAEARQVFATLTDDRRPDDI